MGYQLTHDFKIKDRVRIKELEIDGIIISIWFTDSDIQYEVRYFFNGKAEKIYFYKDELELVI